jgi:hypothetical protein
LKFLQGFYVGKEDAKKCIVQGVNKLQALGTNYKLWVLYSGLGVNSTIPMRLSAPLSFFLGIVTQKFTLKSVVSVLGDVSFGENNNKNYTYTCFTTNSNV